MSTRRHLPVPFVLGTCCRRVFGGGGIFPDVVIDEATTKPRRGSSAREQDLVLSWVGGYVTVAVARTKWGDHGSYSVVALLDPKYAPPLGASTGPGRCWARLPVGRRASVLS